MSLAFEAIVPKVRPAALELFKKGMKRYEVAGEIFYEFGKKYDVTGDSTHDTIPIGMIDLSISGAESYFYEHYKLGAPLPLITTFEGCPIIRSAALELFKKGMRRYLVAGEIFYQFWKRYDLPENKLNTAMIDQSITCAKSDFKEQSN